MENGSRFRKVKNEEGHQYYKVRGMGRQILPNRRSSIALLCLVSAALLFFCSSVHCAAREEVKMAEEAKKKLEEEEPAEEEEEEEEREHPIMGGIRDVPLNNENGFDKEDLARFAVQEYNKKNNALLEFIRVVKAKEQVVSGMMHYLTIEVNDGGKKKLYEAKVWEQLWMNFRQLQEFNYLSDA